MKKKPGSWKIYTAAEFQKKLDEAGKLPAGKQDEFLFKSLGIKGKKRGNKNE